MAEDLFGRELELRRRAERAGQAHLFSWWQDLSDRERARLLEQIDGIDFGLIDRLAENLVRKRASGGTGALEPAPIIPLPADQKGLQERLRARDRGEESLRRGHVAALVAAGGQGTRLGFPGPKGSFPIGPLSGKTLFELFGERILAAGRRYGCAIPWYVMTSPATDAETRGFFREHDFFGLSRDDVCFFEQGTLPAVDRDGRVLMADKAEIALSPDGHGGTFRALRESGALADMERRGIREISYFQVDNVLVKPLDPVFIGFHALAEAEMSSKVVRKAYPEEKVGVLGMRDGKPGVIEYSDLSPEEMRARGPDGELLYWAGSIAVHLIRTDFVRRLGSAKVELPFHRADKKVACIGADGNRVEPAAPNAVKFESFIFDALGYADRSVALEVHRSEEFSPVKNAQGVDSPGTAQKDLMELFALWLNDAGIRVPRTEDGALAVRIEISPLYALDREELLAKIPPRLEIAGDLLLAGEG
ncbi:MAG: UDPGP type 1 family protein [bacterium]